ncbi:MAG: hypothetical protein ACJ8IR_09210 [Alphaproteobacteria bacterium]|jgi:hypothetical protein
MHGPEQRGPIHPPDAAMPLTPEDTEVEEKRGLDAAARLAAATDFVKQRPIVAALVAIGAGVLIARMLF